MPASLASLTMLSLATLMLNEMDNIGDCFLQVKNAPKNFWPDTRLKAISITGQRQHSSQGGTFPPRREGN